MESENTLCDSETCGITPEKNPKVVTLRPMGNRHRQQDINFEPEMIELKRMIKDGELDPERITDHLHKG